MNHVQFCGGCDFGLIPLRGGIFTAQIENTLDPVFLNYMLKFAPAHLAGSIGFSADYSVEIGITNRVTDIAKNRDYQKQKNNRCAAAQRRKTFAVAGWIHRGVTILVARNPELIFLK